MTCKQCGTDEDRLKGFCSIECRDKFDYEEEISELKAVIRGADSILSEIFKSLPCHWLTGYEWDKQWDEINS